MITLTFTQEQLTVIDAAIQGAPYRVAAPLIAEINKQLQRQFDAAVDARDMPSGATKQPEPYTGD